MKSLDIKPAPRRLYLEDLPLCTELVADRSWAPEVDKWRLLLVNGECWGLDRSDKKLAAVAVFMRYGTTLGVLGVLLVRRDCAGQGLGRSLSEFILKRAESASVYLHAFEMGQPLYEKLDFHTVDHLATFTGQFFSLREDKNKESSSEPGHMDKIFQFDREAFGADRSRFLGELGAMAHSIRIVEKGGHIVGYGLAWKAAEVMHVGPIVADDFDIATLLITDLAGNQTHSVRLDFYASHDRLFEWLRKRGLSEKRSIPVMVLGKQALPGKRSKIYTVAMPVTG